MLTIYIYIYTITNLQWNLLVHQFINYLKDFYLQLCWVIQLIRLFYKRVQASSQWKMIICINGFSLTVMMIDYWIKPNTVRQRICNQQPATNNSLRTETFQVLPYILYVSYIVCALFSMIYSCIISYRAFVVIFISIVPAANNDIVVFTSTYINLFILL